ncbi:MAG: hypothetical protein RLZZ383_1575 [Pseudomonadota bacterium]
MPGMTHPAARQACEGCRGSGLVVQAGPASTLVAVACACVAPVCPACGGGGWIAQGPGFRAPRVRCGCARVEARGRLLGEARLPNRYVDATLDRLEPRGGAAAATAALSHFVRSAAAPGPMRGVVLHGAVGLGKTHLLVAALRALTLEHGVSARFIEFSHLLSDLKSSFEQGTTAEVMASLDRRRVLAIDELGKGRNTEFELSVLDELVSRRYNEGLPILAATNYAPSTPTGRATPNLAAPRATEPALVERVSERVYSRLQEVCLFVPIHGEDRRVTPRPR